MLTERRSYNFGRSGVPRMHDHGKKKQEKENKDMRA
jgi:hypothetical protein